MSLLNQLQFPSPIGQRATAMRIDGWESPPAASFAAGPQVVLTPIHSATVFALQAGFYIAEPKTTFFVADDWIKFKQLSEDWREERGATSSITDMALCDSYQKIIGMGEKAIPLILRELEDNIDEPDQWFWALQVLTWADPVTDDERGDFSLMARSWLRWAANNGYAW